MMVINHSAIIEHDALTDEQARLISKIAAAMQPVVSMSHIRHHLHGRGRVSDDELRELITHEMKLPGIETMAEGDGVKH